MSHYCPIFVLYLNLHCKMTLTRFDLIEASEFNNFYERQLQNKLIKRIKNKMHMWNQISEATWKLKYFSILWVNITSVNERIEEDKSNDSYESLRTLVLLLSITYFYNVCHVNLALVVAGAAPEPADPHVPAAAVSSHVPPRHPFPRRPAEDDSTDAAWDGGMLRGQSWDVVTSLWSCFPQWKDITWLIIEEETLSI